MNILIAADLITFSGVGNYICDLSKQLAKNGHCVVVAAPINDLGIGANDGIIFEKLGKISKNPLHIAKNIKIISKIVKKYGIDVIHVNHRMISFIVSLYNRFHKHVPTVWTAHTVPYPTSLSKRIFAYYGDRSIAISTEAKEFMINSLHIKENKIDLILNGVDESKLSPLNKSEIEELQIRYDIDKTKKIICMHGRVDAVKGIDLLVEAINMLNDEEKSKFLVVASGKTDKNAYYDKIYELLKQYNLIHMFKFVGWVPTRNILGLADLMIAPSRREGFPLSVIEAFIMGVPVVRTKVGGYTDMKNVCIGIEPEKPNEIAEKIKQFLHDSNYEDLKICAKAFALENCTIEKMASFVLQTYIKAIKYHKGKK